MLCRHSFLADLIWCFDTIRWFSGRHLENWPPVNMIRVFLQNHGRSHLVTQLLRTLFTWAMHLARERMSSAGWAMTPFACNLSIISTEQCLTTELTTVQLIKAIAFLGFHDRSRSPRKLQGVVGEWQACSTWSAECLASCVWFGGHWTDDIEHTEEIEWAEWATEIRNRLRNFIWLAWKGKTHRYTYNCLQIPLMQNRPVLPTEQWLLSSMNHRHFKESEECFGHLMQKSALEHNIYILSIHTFGEFLRKMHIHF